MSAGTNGRSTDDRFDLRAARLNKGLSLRQAGREIGVAGGTIANLEAGKHENCHPATLKKIADYFDVQVTDLVPLEDAA